jgi:hypothetical protein
VVRGVLYNLLDANNFNSMSFGSIGKINTNGFLFGFNKRSKVEDMAFANVFELNHELFHVLSLVK